MECDSIQPLTRAKILLCALLDERHTAFVADPVGDPAAKGGSDRRYGDQQVRILVLSCVEDQHQVSDAGDWQGNEARINNRNEEQTHQPKRHH